MKILHITPAYKPAWIYGGPTLSVSRLCEKQREAGAEVTVFTTTANGSSELDVPAGAPQDVDGVPVYYFPRWTGDHTHFSPALLGTVWRQARQFDVIHIHSWWNLVSVLSVGICYLLSVRPVLSPRGMLSAYGQESGKRRLKQLLQRLIGKRLLRATNLHATSRQEQLEGRKIIPGWRGFIAPNIIELPKLPSKPNGKIPDDPPFQLLFLSRIHPKKGLDFLLEALSRVSFPWQLTIAGAGTPEYEQQLRQLAKTLGIADRIKWHGWAEGREKNRLLAGADLFVLTSRNENFANAALEAWALGTPVLLSRHVGLSEHVREGASGWVCDLDPSNIRGTLQTAWQHRAQIHQARSAIAGWAHREFAAGAIARTYLEAYEKLV